MSSWSGRYAVSARTAPTFRQGAASLPGSSPAVGAVRVGCEGFAGIQTFQLQGMLLRIEVARHLAGKHGTVQGEEARVDVDKEEVHDEDPENGQHPLVAGGDEGHRNDG